MRKVLLCCWPPVLCSRIVTRSTAPFSPSLCNFHTWIYAALAETSLLVLSGPFVASWGFLAQYGCRCLRILVLTIMCAIYAYRHYSNVPNSREANEAESLLYGDDANGIGYGATNESHKPEKSETSAADANGSWVYYFIGFSILFPYLW